LDNWREDKDIASAVCVGLDMMSVQVQKQAGDCGLVLLSAFSLNWDFIGIRSR
jgi:hypothetical protein